MRLVRNKTTHASNECECLSNLCILFFCFNYSEKYMYICAHNLFFEGQIWKWAALGAGKRRICMIFSVFVAAAAAAAVSLWIVSSRMKNDIVPIDTIEIFYYGINVSPIWFHKMWSHSTTIQALSFIVYFAYSHSSKCTFFFIACVDAVFFLVSPVFLQIILRIEGMALFCCCIAF